MAGKIDGSKGLVAGRVAFGYKLPKLWTGSRMPRFFEGKLTAEGLRFAIVVSRWNSFITEELLGGALDHLRRHGVRDEDVDVVRCAGAFELGPACKAVLTSGKGRYHGLIALGAVIRGGTPHFDFVAGEVSKALGALAMETPVAVSFGVLTTDSIEQAIERAGTKAGNKGAEAAGAAIEQANLFKAIADGAAR
jgi:6,7-dimethyl-8-ribityllumazine synthase